MADRYFVEPPIVGDRATLVDSEAHHLLHVMRAKPGLEVVLFDGLGAEFPARVERLSRAAVELAILDRQEIDRELPFHLTLGVALPKGDRQKWLVEKLVELGVTRLVPLATERGVAQPAAGSLARLRRGVIEASKQCGRNRLMQVAEPLSWSDFISSDDEMATKLIAHPGAESESLAAVELHDAVSIAIGPEGGFTDQEVALARTTGWRPVQLGPRILRVETAAVAAAAACALRAGR